MKLLTLSLMVLALTAAPALGQGCCGACGMAQSGGLGGLKLVSLAGDTVDLSQHVGKMPMVMLAATPVTTARWWRTPMRVSCRAVRP